MTRYFRIFASALELRVASSHPLVPTHFNRSMTATPTGSVFSYTFKLRTTTSCVMWVFIILHSDEYADRINTEHYGCCWRIHGVSANVWFLLAQSTVWSSILLVPKIRFPNHLQLAKQTSEIRHPLQQSFRLMNTTLQPNEPRSLAIQILQYKSCNTLFFSSNNPRH